MEEINSENNELTNYQLYCDRVNLYNQNIENLNNECEYLIDIILHPRMKSIYPYITSYDIDNKISYIMQLQCHSPIIIYKFNSKKSTIMDWWRLIFKDEEYKNNSKKSTVKDWLSLTLKEEKYKKIN